MQFFAHLLFDIHTKCGVLNQAGTESFHGLGEFATILSACFRTSLQVSVLADAYGRTAISRSESETRAPL